MTYDGYIILHNYFKVDIISIIFINLIILKYLNYLFYFCI